MGLRIIACPPIQAKLAGQSCFKVPCQLGLSPPRGSGSGLPHVGSSGAQAEAEAATWGCSFCGNDRSTGGQGQPHKHISSLNLVLAAFLLTKSRPETKPKVQVQGWEVHTTSPFTMRPDRGGRRVGTRDTVCHNL